MRPLIQCAYCGKITTMTRSDKTTCSNTCSVKLIYARNHNFISPFETFIRNIDAQENKGIGEDLKILKLSKIENNTLFDLEEKIKKYSNKLKTI